MGTRADAPFRVFGGIVIGPGAGQVSVRTVGKHGIQYNGRGIMKEIKQNIRYLGFEATDDGRRFDFSITGVGQESKRVSLVIPALLFTGVNKITFQESAKICYEKLRVLLERDRLAESTRVNLTVADIAEFR